MATAICKLCNQEIKTTHPMQTIRAQMISHLRSVHKYTVNNAKLLCIRWGLVP